MEISENKLPNNLLYEIFRLGMVSALSCRNKVNPVSMANKCEDEMNSLAIKFGFSGLDYFDKYFEGDN